MKKRTPVTVAEKIAAGLYDSRLPYGAVKRPDARALAQRDAWRADTARLEEEFWTDLARENGVEGLPAAVVAGIRSVAQRGSFERVWGEIAPRYPAVAALALMAYSAGCGTRTV